MPVPERKRAQSTGLSKTVLMFYLSNGPCKLAPLRPEIHIFSRTHWFSIRQVIRKKSPRGALISVLFRHSYILFQLGWCGGWRRALRVSWGLAEEMEQKTALRARWGWWFLGQRVGREATPILGRKGASIPAPGRRGGQPADTMSSGTFTPTAPLSFPLISSSCSSLLNHKTVKTWV